MHLTMEDWTHKPHRQGLFSSNAIAKIFNSWRDQRVSKGELLSWESQSSSNIVRVGVGVVNQWWIGMIFRRKFSVPKFCKPRSIQATHAHACHSEVSIRLFGFVVCKAICFGILQKSAPCFHVTKTTNQWRIVEIELLATLGWKWGCQPFSCRCSLNVMHCRKEICSAWWTCLSKDIHAFCQNLRIQFLPDAWGAWERQHAPSALHDGCIMLAKDRVEVSKIWITGHWLWSRLSYIRDCCRSMKNCRDSAFSLRGLACEPISCRCSQHVTRCLSEESIVAVSFWNSKLHSSTLLHHSQIHCSWRRKPVSCRKAKGLVTELWFPKIVTIYWSCSSMTTGNKAFSLRGLEAGLWAFWLQMFATCDDMLFFGIHSRHSFLEFQASTPYQKLEAPESCSTLHQLCIMVASWSSLGCSGRKKTSLKTSLMQRSKGFGHGVVVSKICYVQYSHSLCQRFGL